MMKKAIVALSALFVMVYAEHDTQEAVPVCMSWKQTIMAHWDSLSHIHKPLVSGLVGLSILWIIWRLVSCGKGGCGCHCGDTCNCK